jgi:hypothetical protein
MIRNIGFSKVRSSVSNASPESWVDGPNEAHLAQELPPIVAPHIQVPPFLFNTATGNAFR